MSTQVLRSRMQRVLAYVSIDHHGVHVIRDAQQKILGRYDPRTNRTLDHQNRILGRGYLLPRLIHADLREEDFTPIAEDESHRPPTIAQVQANNKRRLHVQSQMQDERSRSSSRLQNLKDKLKDL